MKLLMITRKVDRNDHLAGFIYNWVKKLAEQVEHLYVISWQEGDSTGLPDNVTVKHLRTKQNKLLKIFLLKIWTWKFLGKVDGLFCHQMPIYTIVAGSLARIRGKKVVSWYTHRQVDFKMKLMTKIANVVLTASRESFCLSSKKVVVTGHGIDTDIFSFIVKEKSTPIKIISVGRISPTKNYETIIKAIALLKRQGVEARLSIVGDVGLVSQNQYLNLLNTLVIHESLEQNVAFLGSRPNTQIPGLLHESDIFINMSGTGSLDKAILEAMSTGCIPITSNVAFKNILPPELHISAGNVEQLVQATIYVVQLQEDQRTLLQRRLRQEVELNHDLSQLAIKIVSFFN